MLERLISAYEYAQDNYIKRYDPQWPAVCILLIWTLYMTLEQSLILDGMFSAPTYEDTTFAALLITGAGTILLSVIALIRWDLVNGVMFATQSICSWCCYRAALWLPIAAGRFGRMAYVTIVAFIFSYAICILIYRKTINRVEAAWRIK